MFDREAFEKEKLENAAKQADDGALNDLALEFIVKSDHYGYGYQWTWLGLPVIQMPQDIVAVQEIIWSCRPTLIIETGIAWGGSVVLYASLLQLIGGAGRVIAVDRVLPDKNRERINAYPFSDRIELLCGSSIDTEIVDAITASVGPDDRVMVLLDSNHTHEHVLAELEAYAPLVTPGQYLVVSDTIVDHIPEQTHRPRPWGPGNNPATALKAYLATTDRFSIDTPYRDKMLLSYSLGGYARCVSDGEHP